MLEVQSQDLTCIQTGSSMAEAKELMTEKRIRHLPVINDRGQIIAMLSKHDLTDVGQFQDLPVELFASFPVHFVEQDTPLSSVALKMIEEKISSLILCDFKSRAIGIITTDDLLFEFSKLLKQTKEFQSTTPLWPAAETITTAGELFRQISDIGI